MGCSAHVLHIPCVNFQDFFCLSCNVLWSSRDFGLLRQSLVSIVSVQYMKKVKPLVHIFAKLLGAEKLCNA